MDTLNTTLVPSGNAAAYLLVERAIAYLQAHATEQPSLHDLASRLAVSESNLQRTFSAFAGVSPKRFLQYLTKEHARGLLLASRDVLTVSYETGLSSPGRLHDLLVHTEAMSPGEVRLRGAGVSLGYSWIDTPFGSALAACTERGLAYFGFVDTDFGEQGTLDDMRARWPAASLRPAASVRSSLGALFGGWQSDRPLHLALRGTNFQIKVWEALLRIPEGHLVTYRQLAHSVGRPDAVRVVAGAVGRNPISVLIPCHRVIRESGDLGGYHWGLPRKAALIAREAAHAERQLASP